MNDCTEVSAPIEYDRLLRADLEQIFGERNAGRRLTAIKQLYAEDAVLYEPDGVAKGHAAISDAVTALLTRLPPDFSFRAVGPAVGHHGVGRIQWQLGPLHGPAAVTGTDVAHIIHGVIHSLYVFLDPTVA